MHARRILTVAVALVLAFALSGCGEEPTIEGVWTDDDGVTYEFAADGTVRVEDAAFETSATGTWEAGEETLTLEFPDAGEVTVDIVELTSDRLVIEDADGGRFEFTR
jgi:hypothetical protein